MPHLFGRDASLLKGSQLLSQENANQPPDFQPLVRSRGFLSRATLSQGQLGASLFTSGLWSGLVNVDPASLTFQPILCSFMSQINLLDGVGPHPTLFCAIDCYICIWETMCVPDMT